MVITERTQLREMVRIVPVASLAGVDILEQCKRFAMPDKVRGLTPVPFYNLSMKNLAWLWDVVDGDDMMKAVADIFYPSLPAWKRKACSVRAFGLLSGYCVALLSTFTRYTYEIIEQVKGCRLKHFQRCKSTYRRRKRLPGIGQPDPEAVHKR